MILNRPTPTVQPKLDPGLLLKFPNPQPYPIEKGFQDRLPNELWKTPTKLILFLEQQFISLVCFLVLG